MSIIRRLARILPLLTVWALTDVGGTIKNIIVYDGVATYTPAAGLTLQTINTWLVIGSNKDDPAP